MPQAPALAADLLFVLDSAPSMIGARDNLVINMQRFVNYIENVAGGPLDLHVGVVTSNLGAGGYEVAGCSGMGDGGLLQVPDGCPIDGTFLSDTPHPDGNHTRNYAGSFADAFRCLTTPPLGTCEIRQPIAAALRAVAPGNLANSGFVRDGVYLVIVFVTDGDDCSAADPALFDADAGLGLPVPFRCFEHGVVCDPDEPRVIGDKTGCTPRLGPLLVDVAARAATLKGTKKPWWSIAVATVSGGPEPVTVDRNGALEPVLEPQCNSPSATAAPAVRLRAFVEEFPMRSTWTSLCNDDISDAVGLLPSRFDPVIANPCIEGDIDLDPDLPGAQVDCVVSDFRFDGNGYSDERPIPACSSVPPPPDERPCWHLDPDLANCSHSAAHLVLAVDRAEFPPNFTMTIARCSTGCRAWPDDAP